MRLPDTGRYSHPKVRTSTTHAWFLDEHTLGAAKDIVGSATLDIDAVQGATVPPWTVDGPTGKARRFLATQNQGLWGAASITASDRTDLVGNWTARVLVRPRSRTTLQTFFAASGINTDGVAAENGLLVMTQEIGGKPSMTWENGTGANIFSVATNYVLPLNVWTLLEWRKRNQTGEGPAGTCDLDLIVNGHLVETFAGIQNASGGAAARWRVGSTRGSGSVASSVADADIGGVYFDSTPLDIADSEKDIRRVHGLAFHTRAAMRVTMQDQDGLQTDLSDVDGLDFVDSVTLTNDIDNPSVSASIDLLREQGKQTLATLVTNAKANLSDPGLVTSFSPLVALGNKIEVFAARVPVGIEPGSRDWFSKFEGNIDEIGEGGQETITLSCRDKSGRLIDTFIETEFTYSDEVVPIDVEVAMQEILDDNDDTLNGTNSRPAKTGSYAPVTLKTPTSPAWLMKPWKQRREPVLGALKTLSGQIGADVFYKYDQDPLSRGWKLTFEIPNRLDPGVATVLAQEDIVNVTQLDKTILLSRNVVEVIYRSSETSLPVVSGLPVGITLEAQGWVNVDGEGNRTNAYVRLINAASIARLGRRLFMAATEASSGQIDTVSEVQNMCAGMLQDLADEDLSMAVQMPLMPELELNDIMRILPNDTLHTSAQTLAIRTVTETYDSGSGQTAIQMRGKPSVGQKRWLKLDTRPGGGKPSVNDGANTLTDATGGDLVAPVRSLLDGTSYFTGGKFLAVRNPTFQSWTSGRERPPDGWSLVGAAAMGVDFRVENNVQKSGGHSLAILASGVMQSDLIPVDGDFSTPYSIEIIWQRVAAGALPVVELEWIEKDGATVALPGETLTPGSGFPAAPASTGVWITSRVDGRAPPSSNDARFLRLKVSRTGTNTVYLDSISAYRTARALNATLDTVSTWGDPGIKLVSAAPRNARLSNISITSDFFDHGFNHFVSETGPSIFGHYWETKEPGTVDVSASVRFEESVATAGGTFTVGIELVRNAVYDTANAERLSGTVIASSQKAILFTGGFASEALKLPMSTYQMQQNDRLTIDYLLVAGSPVNELRPRFGKINDRTRWSIKLRTTD